MDTELGVLLRLDREINKYQDNIETLKSVNAPDYLVAIYSQIKANKIQYKQRLLKAI